MEINIRGTIASLKVDDCATFPIERADYVLSCRSRLQKVLQTRYESKMLETEIEIKRIH